MRTIAIIILLLVLLIVGIRMTITTAASEKAIYKKALFDWVTSLGLVFLLHYLIRGIIWVNEALVDVIAKAAKGAGFDTVIKTFASFDMLFNPDFVVGWASVIIYVMVTIQTLMFLITYIKRMLTLAFLIIISPLITITYSIDKMGDQKAQALNTWLKEFAYNVLIQPFHCILYVVFVSMAIKTATEGAGSLGALLFALLSMKFVWDGEKIVRKIFGFEQASSLGAVAASGAMIGAALGKAKSAGSAVSSGVKFAKNTKTGQAIKKKMGERKETKGLSHTAKKEYKEAKKSGNVAALESIKNDPTKRSTFKKASDKVSSTKPIRAMKSVSEKTSTRAKSIKEAVSKSRVGTTYKKFKNSDFGKAIGSDAKKFARKLYSPESIAKVSTAVMAGAAMYALPEQNLLSAATMGYAAGKSAETGVRNFKERKKENFEDNVLDAWNRHCEINGISEKGRTKENFDNWYKNTYQKGETMDEYSGKNMGKAEAEAEKSLKDKGLDESDIDSIIAKIQKAVLQKEPYNPSEMFKGYDISPEEIAAAVQGYAGKFNESYLYQQTSAYNSQMNPYGITHEDALEGIDESDLKRSSLPVTNTPEEHSTESTETSISEELITEAMDGVDDKTNFEQISANLQRIVESRMNDIASKMQSNKESFSNAYGGNAENIISKVEQAVRDAMASGGDVGNAIESQLKGIANINGHNNAVNYGKAFYSNLQMQQQKAAITPEAVAREIAKRT